MKSDLSIACTLTAEELRRGRDGLLPGVLARAETHERTDGGCRFRFKSAAGLLPEIALMMEAERRCCRFFHFHLTAAPDEGPIWLEVTGPPGAADFLAGWLAGA